MYDSIVKTCVMFFVLLCFITSPSAHGKVIYVDDDATGLGNGSSWADAYRFLQDALADANDSAKPVEIRVAQGIYKPDQGSRWKHGDVEATFRLINGVALRGGYRGRAEPDPEARDIKRYESVLSGDLTDDDPDVNDPRDLLHPTGWNSRTVVTGSGTNRTAVLDGFTIKGGHYPIPVVRINGKHPPQPTGSGGGLNNLAGSPTVIGCTFIGNMTGGAGAGMCNAEGSHPSVTDCVFVRNYANTSGGAVANSGHSDPTLTRCTFAENLTWGKGGAVYNNKGSPTLDRCTFTHNATISDLDGSGGALFNLESTPVLVDCVFIENTASYGGAISGDQGGELMAKGCLLARNHSQQGGAVFDWGRQTHSVFSDCTFSGNAARASAGAVRASDTVFSNCLFAGNRALGYTQYDGARHRSTAGAIYDGGLTTLSNCTFDNNWADFGCALYAWYPLPPAISNCIFSSSTDHIHGDVSAGLEVRYSNIQGGWPGIGNTDADPCFAEPGYWADGADPNNRGDPNDPDSIWVDGDYHLKSQAGRWDLISESWVKDEVTSPCIDTGDPNSPIGSEPFPNGGRINMGAYGGTAEASKSYFGVPVCETVIAGDINGDCRVDFRDLEVMAGHWLQEQSE